MTRVYIGYGSQTGNSESIAKELASKIESKVESLECTPLNQLKKVDLKANCDVFIVLCSTTGNGDCPENGDIWWRSVKLRSAAKDMFAGIRFIVLGLGDTNYDKFCHMAKAIDKRLGELGGERVLPAALADEATNLEEIVEEWKQNVISYISQTTPQEQPADSQSSASSTHTEDVKHMLNRISSAFSSLSIEQKDTSFDELAHLESLAHQLPSGLVSLSDLLPQLNLSFPEANQCQGKEVDCSSTKIEVISSEHHNTSSSSSHEEWNFYKPFHSQVLSAKWLTNPKLSREYLKTEKDHEEQWGQNKRVVFCELSLKDSNIAYSPGDSLAVCCPNPPFAVDLVLARLKETGFADVNLHSNIQIHKKGQEPEVLTFIEILQYRIDLVSIPKKAVVNSLSFDCSDENERLLMQFVSGKDANAKKLWLEFVEKQGLGVAEILSLFPSCKPSLNKLLHLLSPVAPRYYSIASSPLIDADKVAIAFSLVRNSFSQSSDRVIRKLGVCTSFLEFQLRSWLYSTSSLHAATHLRIFHRPNPNFHLPGSVNWPLILIGPGTGVAPFMSFLYHRYKLEQDRQRKTGAEVMSSGLWRGGFELEESDLPCENNNVNNFICQMKPGPVDLFYGCRNEDDYLFKSELESFLKESHTLNRLEVAMSRLANQDKVYVTHKLQAMHETLAKTIVDESAHVYICGDGNQMAKDVMAAIKQMIVSYKHISEEEADRYISEMKTRRRLMLDIWS